MELWDLYDKDRLKLGKTHERGKPITEGEYHIVADVWSINKEGMILITQRHPDKPYGLLWECSGGSITVGETSLVGAARELKEEVGLDVKADELELLHTIRLSDRFVDTYITCQDFKIKDLELQEEEVVDARFVTFDEMIAMWSDGLVVPRQRIRMYSTRIKDYIINMDV